jgi:hypothetical protein
MTHTQTHTFIGKCNLSHRSRCLRGLLSWTAQTLESLILLLLQSDFVTICIYILHNGLIPVKKFRQIHHCISSSERKGNPKLFVKAQKNEERLVVHMDARKMHSCTQVRRRNIQNTCLFYNLFESKSFCALKMQNFSLWMGWLWKN